MNKNQLRKQQHINQQTTTMAINQRTREVDGDEVGAHVEEGDDGAPLAVHRAAHLFADRLLRDLPHA